MSQLPPEQYLRAPEDPPGGLQDPEVGEEDASLDEFDEEPHGRHRGTAVFIGSSLESPRERGEALQFAQEEWRGRSRDWTNYCQMFVRMCWGIPVLFGSAWAQWQGADAEDRHEGGSPSDAPLGSALCFKGSSPHGHIMLAARPFDDGTPAAWSNDLVRRGHIDKAARTAPVTAWNQKYLGYLTAVNHYDLQLGSEEPPAPKQPRRYRRIEVAADNIAVALATAQRRGDVDDVEVLTRELRRLRRLHNTLEKERS